MAKSKLVLLLSLAMLLCNAVGCTPPLHETGDAPFKGEISTTTYDQRGECSIIRKVTAFGNENYYYDDGKTLTFLLNV